MKVIVIGASGFVGDRVLARLTDTEANITACDIRPLQSEGARRCEFRRLDVVTLNDSDVFSGADVIINLAAEHRDNVSPLSKYHHVNVDGAKNVCSAAATAGVSTIIFTSSVAIYGFAPANTDEGGEPKYFNEYGKTKFEAEQVYMRWQAEDPKRRSLIIVRPTVIFGPGNRGNVYNLIKQIADGRFAMFGNGRNVKSMAYVENVADFLVQRTAEGPGVHIYNYVDKPDLSMNELVQVVRKTLFNKSGVGLRLPKILGVAIGFGFDFLAWLIRRPLPISSIRVKKFMATTQFSTAVAETGFKAPYTLAEGLEETLRYEFLEDNRDKPTYDTE